MEVRGADHGQGFFYTDRSKRFGLEGFLDLPPGFSFDWNALTPPFGTLCSPLIRPMVTAPRGPGYLKAPQDSDFS